MKSIGIIGGITPKSTEKFHSILTGFFSRTAGHNQPVILVSNVDMFRFVEDLKDKKKETELLRKEISKLQDRVDFIAIVCNTAHNVIEALQRSSKVPILPIYKAVSERVRASGAKKVGLLGTRITLKEGFYQKELQDSTITVVTLPDEDINRLNDMIFSNILYWKDLDTAHVLIDAQIKKLQKMGCDGVILGCTELELFVKEEDYSLKLFPSTRVLAEAVFEEATKKNKIVKH